jgi:4-amino-4-deoxy-L-arabinose transferase-like glycosyltransferase
MKAKMFFHWIKKRKTLVILVLIIAFGAFLRSYHFSDWLHFELDQSRDAKVINLAVEEGPGSLPLLGPRAGGSFLRLGPVFYYFKYASALIFGNTPSGIAVIIMIFGILAMPAFYFLVRRYFSKIISFSLLGVFATSLFLVMYSRFSWNPNPLPLFTILAFYGLLKAVDGEEKNRGKWLLVSAFSISVATQLHFLAFVSVPVIAIALLAIKRPKIMLKYWIGALAIILAMNFPVILNEIKTGGGNISQLYEVILGKTDKESEKSLLRKIEKNYREHSAGYFLILSSKDSELPTIQKVPSFAVICDLDCKQHLPTGVASVIFFSLGAILLASKAFSEKDSRKKDFLLMISIWLVISFGLFLPIAFSISPRFWLLASAMPFIFLGLIFEFFGKIMPKKLALCLIVLIVLFFCVSNLYETYKRFDEMKKAPYEAFATEPDRILKEKNRITLEQQYMAGGYIESFYIQNKYPVYLDSDPFHKRSLTFILESKKIPTVDFKSISKGEKVYRNGNYFLVFPSNANLDKEMGQYSGFYNLSETKQFGTLKILHFVPKLEAINREQQEVSVAEDSNSKDVRGVPKRYTWEEIFNESEEAE